VRARTGDSQLRGMHSFVPPPPSPACTSPFADLFAIIKATDKLERAYVRDAIKSEEYEASGVVHGAHGVTHALMHTL
jgi:hypothetical protein